MTNVLGELFIVLGLKSTLDADVKQATSSIDKLGSTADNAARNIGIGLTGAGAGILALADHSRKLNAELAVTALQIGSTTAEMRALAIATTNVTFPLSEVNATFDLLSRAGVKTEKDLQSIATTFDTLGDAIGRPASEVTATLIPAFNAFGIPLENAADNVDMLTHLFRNTTIEISDFSSTVSRLAPDIEGLGLSMADTVGIMEALAAKGIQGAAATREFRTAVSSADGDIAVFLDTLGLTASEVDAYVAELANAEGMTQDFADAANTQYGVLDKLRQQWSVWKLQLGSTLEPLEGVGAAMVTMGPAMMALPPILSMVSAAQGMTAATAWAMIAPYLAVIAPIAVVIGALYLLEKKYGTVSAAADYASIILHNLSTLLKDKVPASIERTTSFINGLSDRTLAMLGPIGAVVLAYRHWDEIVDISKTVFNQVSGFVWGIIETHIRAVDALLDVVEGAGKALGIDMPEINVGDSVTNAIAEVRGLVDYLTTDTRDAAEGLAEAEMTNEEDIEAGISLEERYKQAIEESGKAIENRNAIKQTIDDKFLESQLAREGVLNYDFAVEVDAKGAVRPVNIPMNEIIDNVDFIQSAPVSLAPPETEFKPYAQVILDPPKVIIKEIEPIYIDLTDKIIPVYRPQSTPSNPSGGSGGGKYDGRDAPKTIIVNQDIRTGDINNQGDSVDFFKKMMRATLLSDAGIASGR